VALALAAVVAFLVPESKSHPVAWQGLSAGRLEIAFQERRLFRDRGQLEGFLTQHGVRKAPTVDFSSRQLLLLTSGPRSSTGYAIEVLGASEKEGNITVKVRERTPTLDERVAPHVTYPYRLISLPAGKDVFVDWVGR
jgi:hypothetical protein